MATKKTTNSQKTATNKVAGKKAPAKKAPVKKAPVKKAPVKKAPAKKAPAKKAPVKKTASTTPTKRTPVTKTTVTKTPAAKTRAPAKKSVKAAPKKASTSKKVVQHTAASAVSLHGIEPYVEKKNEEYMGEPQRAHFKNILFAWKRELMEEVDRTVTHMKDEAANFPDPADRATQEEEFSLELRTRDRERKLIKKIDKTLLRLEDDDYGFCDQCGIEIGIRRLEARPTAELCVDCKTLDEIREKQISGG